MCAACTSAGDLFQLLAGQWFVQPFRKRYIRTIWPSSGGFIPTTRRASWPGTLGRGSGRRGPTAALPRHSRAASRPRLSRPKLERPPRSEQLPGARRAAERIIGRRSSRPADRDLRRLRRRRHDGTALLVLCLEAARAEVGYYVPNRIDEGYGLNCEALRHAGRPRGANGHHRRLRRRRACAEAETARASWASS